MDLMIEKKGRPSRSGPVINRSIGRTYFVEIAASSISFATSAGFET
jgi:hypothetical protein